MQKWDEIGGLTMPRPTYEEALAKRDAILKAHKDEVYRKAANKLHSQCHSLAGALMSGECPSDPRVFVAELVGYLYEYEEATGEDFPAIDWPKEKASLKAEFEKLKCELLRAGQELHKHGLQIPPKPETPSLSDGLSDLAESGS